MLSVPTSIVGNGIGTAKYCGDTRIYDWLNAKTKSPKKNSEMIGVFLWPSSSPDFKSFDYTICSILENTNANSHLNIGSIKTAVEEEWNKMSEEFILKSCKSF